MTSEEIVLCKNLKWPKYGISTLFATAFIFIGNVVNGYMNYYITSIQVGGIETYEIICSGIPSSISLGFTFGLHFTYIIFLLSWINEFSEDCIFNEKGLTHGKATSCLKKYKSLQVGFGMSIYKITNIRIFNRYPIADDIYNVSNIYDFWSFSDNFYQFF